MRGELDFHSVKGHHGASLTGHFCVVYWGAWFPVFCE